MSLGCDYMKPSFTVPAGSAKIKQMQWDLAFMDKKTFMETYKMSEVEYEKFKEE